MSAVLPSSRTGLFVADRPTVRHETAGCPACGQPLTISTDGLTGRVHYECARCGQRASAWRRRQAYARDALRFVAGRYGLSVEDLDRALSRARARRRVSREAICARCGEPFTVFYQSPRGVRYCSPCSKSRWRELAGLDRRSRRRYKTKACQSCGARFQPTGPREVRCKPCRRRRGPGQSTPQAV